MEEAAELGNYLPLSFKTRSEQDYIAFLWGAFAMVVAGWWGFFAMLTTSTAG